MKHYTLLLSLVLSLSTFAQHLPSTPKPKPPTMAMRIGFGAPRWMENHKKISIPIAIGLTALIVWHSRGGRPAHTLHFIAVPCPSDACIERKP